MISPKVYVPRVDSFTGEAGMELWIPNERKYVRLEDFEEERKQNAQARSLMTTDIADVRLNETKLSMKMSRLLQFISQQLHLSENSVAYCTCPRCDVLLKIRDVLNAEPPIKAGTQPVAIAYAPASGNGGLGPQEGVLYPASEPGFAQGVRAKLDEADNQCRAGILPTGDSTREIFSDKEG